MRRDIRVRIPEIVHDSLQVGLEGGAKGAPLLSDRGRRIKRKRTPKRPFPCSRWEPETLQSEILLAVEHGKGVGDGVVGQGDGADGLRQADGLVQRWWMLRPVALPTAPPV